MVCGESMPEDIGKATALAALRCPPLPPLRCYAAGAEFVFDSVAALNGGLDAVGSVGHLAIRYRRSADSEIARRLVVPRRASPEQPRAHSVTGEKETLYLQYQFRRMSAEPRNNTVGLVDWPA